MRMRQDQKDVATALSGRERGAIEKFLSYIEDRVKGVEPVCADLVRLARLALAEPRMRDDERQILH